LLTVHERLKMFGTVMSYVTSKYLTEF
jgi:hypothetical protein